MHKFYFVLLLCFFSAIPCFSQETALQSNDTAEVEHREHDTEQRAAEQYCAIAEETRRI